MVSVNGKNLDAAGKTIAEYLKNTEYEKSKIAVERNGVIVPRDSYAFVLLEDGDSLEIVSFVGGG